ncbi:MAG: Re/Si-specific NAD(P)(+) transhydrogenase subunit alpha [Candidatus Latescibacteria bacterium]|nr:Re/Si-specific NAD(P)(+) transhydrogenase subunit alpha [Candidatus Latescibacterota bacterium]
MKVGIPKEIGVNERRVAVTPDSVRQIKAAGYEVLVESGAGAGIQVADSAFQEAGASVVQGTADLWSRSEIVLKIQPPQQNQSLNLHEANLLAEGSTLICMLRPLGNPDIARMLAQRRVTSFSMDMMPRTTRAQRMDALSSMSTIAGYKAVLMAADSSPRLFPMLVTAAGTIAPSRVLIVGAGVAGLQAIATARRLGAVVEAYDVRPAVKEEVESLGATFVGPPLSKEETQDAQGYAKALSPEAQRKGLEMLRARIKQADVVITTARVPGLPAPKLISDEDVAGMKPGSVIVDLAADMGGNCAATQAGTTVVRHNVTIHGPVRLANTVPIHATQMYSKNITSFLLHITKDGKLNLDWNDDITSGTCVTRDGQIVHPGTRERAEKGAAQQAGSPARSNT